MSARKAPTGTVLYLALLQLLFTLCWTVYAIYLPALAASVGIAASAIVLILMMDQAIFTIFDVATGVAADRMSRLIGRVGRWVAIVTVVSCAAASAGLMLLAFPVARTKRKMADAVS